MNAFGDILESAVQSAGYADLKAFSKVAGVSQPQLNRIRNGLRTPPLESLDAWAKALDLSESERREFKMLAGLAHVKDHEVRDLIAGELAALRQEVAKLTDDVRASQQ